MLALSDQVLRFSLALWVGGTFVVMLAAPVLFRQIPSRDQAGDAFGEILRLFEAAKHVLSLLLVLAVFSRLEATRSLSGRSFVSGAAIFVAVATNVYLAMVLRPRMKYFRLKMGSSLDSAPAGDPWRARFDRLHRRSVAVLVLGATAAAVALASTP